MTMTISDNLRMCQASAAAANASISAFERRNPTRQEVGQRLQSLAEKVATAIEKTMTVEQRREFGPSLYFAISLFPQLEAQIAATNLCDDNMEAVACEAADTLSRTT